MAAVGLALLLAAACLDPVQGLLRHQNKAEGFVKALEFKHRLRVCNAFPFDGELQIFMGKEQQLTNKPMAYKTCEDFQTQLKTGDKLEFRISGAGATGTFAVADLPSNDAVLLLVATRHDSVSTALAFESHVFANLESAQVAIIDTYKGKASSTPRIRDAEGGSKAKAQMRSEELRFHSVVAVNPGIYDVELDAADGKLNAKSRLVAVNHQSYVILRTGVEAQHGASFPQELVVFPASDPMLLKSSTGRSLPTLLTALLVAAAAAFPWTR